MHLCWWYFLLFFLIAGLVLFFPRLGNKVNWDQPPSVWFLHSALIGNGLDQYRSVHNGRLPSRLSDLVPNYIGYSNVQLFFWPSRPWTITNSNPEILAKEIDNAGAFVYLGENGLPENIIMYERTNLWAKYDYAFIVTTNCIAMPLEVGEIKSRLLNLPSDVVKP